MVVISFRMQDSILTMMTLTERHIVTPGCIIPLRKKDIIIVEDITHSMFSDIEHVDADFYGGGGYLSKGIYRPTDVCRMRNNTAEKFCPVCQRAIERIILYNTTQE